MDNADTKEKKRNGGIIILVIFLALIILSIVFFINLFIENTSYTSNGDKSNSSVSLSCISNSPMTDGFFDFNDATSVTQIIKVMLKNNTINEIAYNANSAYSNESIATNRSADFNAKYGLYMQNNGAKIDDFSPNFTADGVNVRINLFAKKKQLTPATAKIFLIDDDNARSSNYTLKTLSALYRSKGFDCEKIE